MSFFYTYFTSGFTPRHFRFYTYVTFLHLRSNARFVETFIFLTLILVAWEIWRHNLILHQILIYSKKDQKRIIRHNFAKTFSKTAPKIQSFKTPFFSIIERFQRFPKNFLKTKFFEMCIMCRSNLASYIPPTGPLGISLPSFDIRGFHLLESEIL